MNHQQRCDRRKQIAEDISNGYTIAEVAKKYSVSEPLIKYACKEHNVSISPKIVPTRQKTFEIIRDIVLGISRTEIAKRHKVSKQYVHIVLERMHESGLYSAFEKCLSLGASLNSQIFVVSTMVDNGVVQEPKNIEQ